MNAKAAPEATVPAGQRGPAEHERRNQIIRAADEYFRRYGYNKTSVTDLGKAIGVSSAYVYRFFESKQAIGEAVCSQTLGNIQTQLHEIANSSQSAAKRLRLVFTSLAQQSLELFFSERKLHDICATAIAEHWAPVVAHKAILLGVVKKIVADGRKGGEFERKTPLDEACLAISETLMPFAHPVLLEQRNPEELASSVTAVTNLVLRSLSP